MKNLTLTKRLLIASPAVALLIAGTIVWNLKILAVFALVYLISAEFILKKAHASKHD